MGEIGQHLLDALSIGALSAYGRKVNLGIKATEVTQITLIDCNYWKTARFTYDFFVQTAKTKFSSIQLPPVPG